MHIIMFYHSLISDWNHGNAHFLRCIVTELLSGGHWVDVYEPLICHPPNVVCAKSQRLLTKHHHLPLQCRHRMRFMLTVGVAITTASKSSCSMSSMLAYSAHPRFSQSLPYDSYRFIPALQIPHAVWFEQARL